MHRAVRQGLYFVVVVASTLALASDHLTPSTAPSALSRMDVWIGQWQSKTEVLNTPYSEAASLSSNLICSWSPQHGFVLCEDRMPGVDGGTTSSLSVYTYDEQDKVYKFFGVEKDSYPREVPMEVKGNVWSFGTTVQNDNKTILFLTSDEFMSATSVHFRTEFSDDNGQHWKELNRGELTKIS